MEQSTHLRHYLDINGNSCTQSLLLFILEFDLAADVLHSPGLDKCGKRK